MNLSFLFWKKCILWKALIQVSDLDPVYMGKARDVALSVNVCLSGLIHKILSMHQNIGR